MKKLTIGFLIVLINLISNITASAQETLLREDLNKAASENFLIQKKENVNTEVLEQKDSETEKTKINENDLTEKDVDTIYQKNDQKKINKYEIGFHVTWHRQKSYNEKSPVFNVVFGVGGRQTFPSNCCQTEFGFGGRFTYNFSRNFALEIESSFFPVDRLKAGSPEVARLLGTNDFVRLSVEPQGRKLQAFAGPKIGVRKEKYGIFGKVRPGMYWVMQYPTVDVLIPNPPAAIGSSRDWAGFFAVDVGGVFEYYPSKKTVIRFDVGDTIVNYRALNPKQFNAGFIRHTFQFSTGFGFRF